MSPSTCLWTVSVLQNFIELKILSPGADIPVFEKVLPGPGSCLGTNQVCKGLWREKKSQQPQYISPTVLKCTKKAIYHPKQFRAAALQLIIAILYFHPWVIIAEKDACKIVLRVWLYHWRVGVQSVYKLSLLFVTTNTKQSLFVLVGNSEAFGDAREESVTNTHLFWKAACHVWLCASCRFSWTYHKQHLVTNTHKPACQHTYTHSRSQNKRFQTATRSSSCVLIGNNKVFR